MQTMEEKFKKGLAGPVQFRLKLKEAKQKWIAAQVEHEYIEQTLLELEGTGYELTYLMDGNIWARMILKKQDKKDAGNGKRDAKVLPTQE